MKSLTSNSLWTDTFGSFDAGFWRILRASFCGYALLAAVIARGNETFTAHQFIGSDGSQPVGNILADSDGYLYGVTTQGGANSQGTVLKFQPGIGGSSQVLHNFGGPITLPNGLQTQDGSMPTGGLVDDGFGFIWGTTTAGGVGFGTVFKLSKMGDGTPASGGHGSYTLAHVFASVVGGSFVDPCSGTLYLDGQGPAGPLTLRVELDPAVTPVFYGTTSGGGQNGLGTVFGIDSRSPYCYAILHSFSGVANQDGAKPSGSLVVDLSGVGFFYGTTTEGGAPSASNPNGLGTVYANHAANHAAGDYDYSPIWKFNGDADGSAPTAGLTTWYDEQFAPDASSGTTYLFGTTGGTEGFGSVFRLALDPFGGDPPGLIPPVIPPGMVSWPAFNAITGVPNSGTVCLAVNPSPINLNSYTDEGTYPGVLLGTTAVGAAGSVLYSIGTDGSFFNPNVTYPYSSQSSVFPSGGLVQGPTVTLMNLLPSSPPIYGTLANAPGGSGAYGSVFGYFLLPTEVISYSSGQANISYVDPPGVVWQSASSVTGPWTIMPGGSNSYAVKTTAPQQFFRLAFSVTNLTARPPAVTTLPARNFGSNNVTLYGFVIPNGGASTAWFEYGTTTNYGHTTAGVFVNATNSLYLSNSITGLASGTLYHYQLVASNSAGTGSGGDLPLTSLPSGASAPTAVTLAATSVTSTGAVFNGNVAPNGVATTVSWFYGGTTNYGHATSSLQVSGVGTNATTVSNSVSGLSPGVLYHVELLAVNSAGSTAGGDVTFATPPTAPGVETLPASGIDPTNGVLNGIVVPNGANATAWFQYGMTTNYGSLTATTSVTNPVIVSDSIGGLSVGVTYHYRLVASNHVGTVAGADSTFTANFECTTPPSGLAYWWPGEGNALDIWDGNNGTLQGGVTFTTGAVGQAFNLDGASGFVSTSLLITNPQTFSLSLWFRTATTNGGVLISFDSSQVSVEDGSKFDRNIYLDDTGVLHFGVWNSGPQQIDSVAGYNDSNWHQVVGSLSASTGLSLYVDGVLAGNDPAVTNAQENYSGYWRFGEDNLNNWPYQPTSQYFQGQIDEVAIFNTALASQDVANIYAVGSAGMCP